MESNTNTKPSRHADAIIDLIDSVLDNPYWSVFDSEPDGPDFDAEVALERRLAGRD